MDPRTDDNPYQAPQTTTPIVRRRLPPNSWCGVVGVFGSWAAMRIVSYTPLDRWPRFVAAILLGGVLFTAFVYAADKLRRRSAGRPSR